MIQSKTKPYLFVLGGYDLEMVEIRNLLENHDYSYLDAQLSWGASWDAYLNDSFHAALEMAQKKSHLVVGIELANFPKSSGYLSINHHNEHENNPSSIEQVAHLLDIGLNRWQKLVAANDKGWIPALEKFGASPEEINQIRSEDRKVQVDRVLGRVVKTSVKIVSTSIFRSHWCNH